jgi:hypothetical protein
MPPVEMKFVDAASGQPIVGANVFFNASATEGTFTGHGGAKVNLFLVETTTDDAGEIHVAAQSFSSHPFMLGSIYRHAFLVVFKPGYVLVIRQNSGRIIPKLEEMTTWQDNNRTIKMERATTNKERVHALEWAARFADENFRDVGHRRVCAWKQIPRFLVAVHHSVGEWNGQRHQLPEADLRRKQIESPLESLLINEAYYKLMLCGSPGEFFAPYLKSGNR